jgi:PD-(D/E)XK endonuclease
MSGDDEVVEAVAEGEVITIWGMAEDSGRRGRKPAGEGARSSTSSRAAQGLTPKQLGEMAEAEFVAKAVGMGFVVAKPWGDSEPYDFILNVRREFNFWRVQVKSAHTAGEDGICSFRAYDQHQQPYSAEDIDALVAYARPSKAWYVFPVRVVEGLKSLKLYPCSRKRRSKYEKWREAWEILRKVVRRRRRK